MASGPPATLAGATIAAGSTGAPAEAALTAAKVSKPGAGGEGTEGEEEDDEDDEEEEEDTEAPPILLLSTPSPPPPWTPLPSASSLACDRVTACDRLPLPEVEIRGPFLTLVPNPTPTTAVGLVMGRAWSASGAEATVDVGDDTPEAASTITPSELA